jgi:hypothetical protein
MGRRVISVMAVSVATLIVTSALGFAAAQATGSVRVASHISIKSKGLTFSGSVTSANAACVSGRHVTLYRTNGNVLGSTTTSAAGKWKITASGSAGITLGHFFAKVKRRSVGMSVVCKGAQSKTIPFHQ